MAKTTKKKFSFKRFAYLLGGGFVALGAFYAYQPQRIALIQEPLPPFHKLDFDVATLFKKGQTVLIVTAHPDDSEFYMAGMLSKYGHLGARIVQVVCTDGDKAFYTSLLTNVAENRKVRRAEQTEATTKWGAASLTFLAYPDGRLFVSDESRDKIAAIMEKEKPDTMICFDSEYVPRQYHRDHLNSGILAMAAAKKTGIPKAYLYFDTAAPNVGVDIEQSWRQKLELLKIHKSQFHDDRLEMIINMQTDRADRAGSMFNMGMAEAFRYVPAR